MKKELDIFDMYDEFTLTPFEERIYKLAELSIPTSIDRTDDGEFLIKSYYPSIQRTPEGVIMVDHKLIKADRDKEGNIIKDNDKENKKALGYFFNEDCCFSVRTKNKKIVTYFYGDADNEYHFKTNLKESMSDDEIRRELIKGFSAKFGWIELFEDDGDKIKDIDVKFWAVFNYDGQRKLIEVNREFFNQNVKSDEETSDPNYFDAEEDMDILSEYDKLCEMSVEVASKHFKGFDKNRLWAEFLVPDEKDIKECAFMVINIV